MKPRLSTILPILLLIIAANAIGIRADDSISYRPNIHGTIRGRFEASTVRKDYRFQVRNARVSIDGKIAPIADYYLQADFCDRGKIKILDVWARIRAFKELGIQAGQFRMPFGTDPFRGPHTYYFANRSFIGKQMCNYRAVGAKLTWNLSTVPLTIEAGAFNPATISDHTKWHNRMAYAAKATYRVRHFTFSAGYMSTAPDSIRFNIAGCSAGYSSGRWTAEAEYMYKHYTHNSHKGSHGYNVFADYRMPIRTGFFNRLSFQARFDGMTAHSSAQRDDSGAIVTDHPRRNRITLGSTISYIRTSGMFLDLRVNYEKYLYSSGTVISPDNGDKAVVELVLRF